MSDGRASSFDVSAAMRTTLRLLKCAAKNWLADRAATIGAALAFYCAFSLAPLLLILVAIAGWIIGAEHAYSYVNVQMSELFGSPTAKVLMEAMKSSQETEGIVATIVSIFTLLLGATTVFAALEAALEQIWGTTMLVPKGIKGFIRSRILSFGLILAVGFLLLVSLTISAILAQLYELLSRWFNGVLILSSGVDAIVSLTLVSGLFALIYRYMPAKRLPWNVVLKGGAFTAVLFFIGKWAVGLYLAKSTQPTAFGAASSFVALLLWLYYTAQIFLLGAEFTACIGGLRGQKKHAPPQ
jgi:membrane protein